MTKGRARHTIIQSSTVRISPRRQHDPRPAVCRDRVRRPSPGFRVSPPWCFQKRTLAGCASLAHSLNHNQLAAPGLRPLTSLCFSCLSSTGYVSHARWTRRCGTCIACIGLRPHALLHSSLHSLSCRIEKKFRLARRDFFGRPCCFSPHPRGGPNSNHL